MAMQLPDHVRDRLYIPWFSEIRLADVPAIGSENASLGQL
jgi:hypothetical protein